MVAILPNSISSSSSAEVMVGLSSLLSSQLWFVSKGICAPDVDKMGMQRWLDWRCVLCVCD